MNMMVAMTVAVLLLLPLTPEQRAIAFLVPEVQRWPAEHKCFSCHNHGDAARALFTAMRYQYALPVRSLDETRTWLTRPQTWHLNGGDGEFKDEGLTRIQFAAALVAALDAGLVRERRPLQHAAALIAGDQNQDGSWQAAFPADVGSPTTYGTVLATYQARHILQQTDPHQYRNAIDRANAWLLRAPVQRVLDAAVVFLALDGMASQAAADKRRQCLDTLRQGQSPDGGWGPFVNSPPEVFDTAVVVLALARLNDADWQARARKGRQFLITQQKADGSWPETTRPTGAESYAQRMSTSSWALLALLATTPRQ